MAGGSDKSEQPSQRRLLKAREQGNYASARQFIAGAQFLAFVMLLRIFGEKWLTNMGLTMAYLLRRAFSRDLSPNDYVVLLRDLAFTCGGPILLMGFGLMILSLGLQLGLTQMGFSVQKLMPDFKRLSPANKLKQFTRQNFPAAAQALLLLPLSGYAVYAITSEHFANVLTLPLKPLQAGESDVFAALNSLLGRGAGFFFIYGCVDLFREKRTFTKDLKMTKQEIKDEHKETDGNPQTKMRIRRIQRDQARKRMMQNVPKATAVIVNPTHYAVALRYEPESMVAPVVVAKGKNYLALRIRQIALDNQVPLIENPPLARGLYAAADIGQEIPPHLYKAVAEILAYIFRLMHRR
jgi:flagellar biosynthetic protein FlhB